MADPFLGALAAVRAGDTVTGTIADVTPARATVWLDGFPGDPIGVIGALDCSWRSFRSPADLLRPGDRVTAGVIAVDPRRRQIALSRSATENPGLWAFLAGLHEGQRLAGTVAAVESFGVFVALDDGPGHPTFPGVGFITMPELSWRTFRDVSEIVTVGQRITGEFLTFDTTNGEARLSLRATRPEPFRAFAGSVRTGQSLPGTVTKLAPFGVFIRVADGVEGLLRLPAGDQGAALPVGAELAVTVVEIDLPRRRLVLSRTHPAPRAG
ncbi:S1 RNA-binding domain-containing protein [Actinoplanes sp. N902-109]|uniref:S1 RNA-binding domain-containing protein n=1 Tax=Actinoplanes sp. (strain N902-109) TaxID=649831 RepID=UPI0003294337|nr:S1 RNA-binding domain-containing protein [Actinoplanes sp. N902-109]AGL17021.1 30S ribosomal protein S1 [Actinoplanes sp. N902-109]